MYVALRINGQQNFIDSPLINVGHVPRSLLFTAII